MEFPRHGAGHHGGQPPERSPGPGRPARGEPLAGCAGNSGLAGIHLHCHHHRAGQSNNFGVPSLSVHVLCVSTEVTRGLHGCNGMLVTLLMGVFSSSGDWYWWLLVPGCLAAATCTFLHSGLRPLLDPWDLPVSVFPFNTVILLYLSCTGSTNPYFPHHPAERPVAPEHSNNTHLQGLQLLQGVVRGVGQIYACEELWPSLLILLAVLIGSPLLCIHALLGSGAGLLAGLSVAVRCTWLYAGLSGFNGALGCMAVGGLFFKFNWKTHLLSITSAFLSSYGDIALSNLLGTVGLPACSWAATLTVSLMLLLTAHNLSSYRIPLGRVMFPETHQEAQAHRAGADMHSTDV
ncbi:urea transporter 2 isoform X2 [Paramormyrops kingsleyae]|uniref:urea transporter 2 isoform X2 n=1 Tax=Paramormyrops kingsleyae TaxID=1676925 RepID=UPI000CD6229C|nr:urea transporter 1-like isoform X2 [Paramormyrops kingsleyae]